MKLNPKNKKMIQYFDFGSEIFDACSQKCFKEIYDTIKSSNHKNQIKKEYQKLKNARMENTDSTFFPERIQTFIKTTPCHYTKYTTTLENRNIYIHFNTYKHVDCDEYILYMLNVLALLAKFSKQSCKSPELHIYIYFTPFTKTLTHGVINGDNINTGINIKSACSHSHSDTNKIVIFREEDWFKVFIHEAIHSFRLDFMDSGKKLQELFPINTDVNLFEAYTEFWAEIINIIYCAISETDDFSEALEKISRMVYIERQFSLYQAIKILNYMDLKYENILTPSDKYAEETNVFAYFILKACLMYNFNHFILCCKTHGKTLLDYDEKKINFLLQFIHKHHKNPDFLRDIKFMERVNIKNRQLNKTAKMTLFELV